MDDTYVDIFPVKLGVFDFKNDEANQEIFLKALELEKAEGKQASNVGGFHSQNLCVEDLPEELYRFVISSMEAYASQLIEKPFVEIDNFWIIVNRRNAYNAIHTHPCSDFSAVYYIKAPEEGGDLTFFNPSIDLIERAPNQNIFPTLGKFVPQDRKLIVFPSHLKHCVTPNNSDTVRISLAFNARVSVV